MANLPQLIEGLQKLDRDELKAVSLAVDALLAEEPELTEEQWDELEDRLAALDRGEGIRINNVREWLEGLRS